jgi:hypothetical protein
VTHTNGRLNGTILAVTGAVEVLPFLAEHAEHDRVVDVAGPAPGLAEAAIFDEPEPPADCDHRWIPGVRRKVQAEHVGGREQTAGPQAQRAGAVAAAPLALVLDDQPQAPPVGCSHSQHQLGYPSRRSVASSAIPPAAFPARGPGDVLGVDGVERLDYPAPEASEATTSLAAGMPESRRCQRSSAGAGGLQLIGHIDEVAAVPVRQPTSTGPMSGHMTAMNPCPPHRVGVYI